QVAHQGSVTSAGTASATTVHCQSRSDCSGWNVDQLTLDSAAGGGAQPLTTAHAAEATGSTTPGSVGASNPPASVPAVTVTHQNPSAEQVKVSGATSPFELVLGQSNDAGWQAVAQPAAG